jgi:predicted nucleotidyltransferase
MLFGGSLVGIVAYGSWTRQDLSDTSDVDVLVILEAAIGLTRDLYREWDEEPVRWGRHVVEPHFVHFPADDHVSGLWAEAAIDGVVLFDRDLIVARKLVGIRRRIMIGELERRTIHGQPYWVES